MKAESLFHLLQLRLSGLAPDCPASCRDGLAEIQRHLRVTHGRQFFELTWRYHGKDFSLSVADREFAFHVAGDTTLAVDRRGDVTATRLQNWQSAAALWQRLGAISGLSVPEQVFPAGLAPTPAPRVETAFGWTGVAILGASVLVGLAAFFVRGAGPAIGVGLSAFLLASFVWTLDQTHLRKPLGVGGVAVLTFGALVSLAIHWQSLGQVPLLAGIAGAAWLERCGRRDPVLWGISGAMAACAGLTAGWPGSAGALALAFAVLLVGWAAPQKLGRPAALAFAGAAIATAILAGAAGLLTAPLSVESSWATWTAWSIAGGILLPFLVWWIQGSLFHVLPWCSLGALALAAICATAASGATAGVLVLAGLAAVLTWRTGLGFLQSVRGR
jgi:hypothetical protein